MNEDKHCPDLYWIYNYRAFWYYKVKHLHIMERIKIFSQVLKDGRAFKGGINAFGINKR